MTSLPPLPGGYPKSPQRGQGEGGYSKHTQRLINRLNFHLRFFNFSLRRKLPKENSNSIFGEKIRISVSNPEISDFLVEKAPMSRFF